MDPILGHLIDLLNAAPPNSFVLGGGLGLQLKLAHLAFHTIQTLAGSAGYELPEARATTDIDLFLNLAVFTMPEQGKAVRSAIDSLGYSAQERDWQFEKPLTSEGTQSIVLDLLARHPVDGENVKVKSPRVGSGSDTGLHGRETPEAFAVEESPVSIDIVNEGALVGAVNVAHPFALLNMKLRAGHDWHRFQMDPGSLGEKRKAPSGKHVFDAALIVGMMTETELAESDAAAKRWSDHKTAAAIRTEAATLFGSPVSPGWLDARRQGMFDDHDLIWSAMKEALGIDG